MHYFSGQKMKGSYGYFSFQSRGLQCGGARNNTALLLWGWPSVLFSPCCIGTILWSLATSLLHCKMGTCNIASNSKDCYKSLRWRWSKNIRAVKIWSGFWIGKVSEKHLGYIQCITRCIHFQLDLIVWVAVSQWKETFYFKGAVETHCFIMCNAGVGWMMLQTELLCASGDGSVCINVT